MNLKQRIYRMFLNRPYDIVDEYDLIKTLKSLSLTSSDAYVRKLMDELMHEKKIKRMIIRHNIRYVLIKPKDK